MTDTSEETERSEEPNRSETQAEAAAGKPAAAPPWWRNWKVMVALWLERIGDGG